MGPAVSDPQPWQTVFDALSEAVCILDLEGRILNYNPAMAALLGLPADQILGRNCCLLLHGVEHPIPDCPLTRLKESRRRETLTLSVSGRTLQLTAEPLWDESGTLAGAVHLINDMSAQVRERTGLLKKIQELEQAAVPPPPLDVPRPRFCRRQIADREAESRRHHRILSDELGKLLAGLKIELRSLQKKNADPSLSALLAEGLEAIDRSWFPFQDLIDEVRPPLLDDLGLIPALRWEINCLEKRHGVPIRLLTDQQPAGLLPETESACFHLARGALSLPDLQAKSLTVSILLVDNRLELLIGAVVSDLQTARVPDWAGGAGDPAWLELQERIQMIGGKATVRTDSGSRLEILFQIPLADRS